MCVLISRANYRYYIALWLFQEVTSLADPHSQAVSSWAVSRDLGQKPPIHPMIPEVEEAAAIKPPPLPPISDGQIPDIVKSLSTPSPTQDRGMRAQTDDPFSFRGVRTQLVGREVELQQMRAAVEHASESKSPALITIVGNQGTGKSRLVDELLRTLPSTTIISQCEAVRDGAKYSSIAHLLRDRFAIPDSSSEAEVEEEFRREVQAVFGEQGVTEVLHVLGRFLDLKFPDSSFLRVLSENPRQYEEISRTIWRRFVEEDAAKGPVVLVVDDLHLADEGSLSMLLELSETLRKVPVILIVCTSPDLLVRTPSWGHGAKPSLRIELRNLAPEYAEQMFRGMLNRCVNVPVDIVEDAVEMTGGNPNFLDQLIRLYLANGTIDASNQGWVLDPDRAMETDLPITVGEVIEARISSLALAERDILEKGAIFGNVFWLGSIVALTRLEVAANVEQVVLKPAGALDYAWNEARDETRRDISEIISGLVERDYLLRLDDEDSTVAGDVEFVFKHNLERELVANSTETEKLERYHRLAAQWMETTTTVRSEEQLEFLGQLYARGGDRRRAANAFIAAGDRGRARYANEQAVELYRQGLSLLDEDDAVVLLDALHNMGSVLDLVGNTKEAQLLFSRMLRHAWLLDHRSKGGAAHNRLGRVHRRLGEYDLAMSHLRSAQELFKAAKDDRGIAGTLDDIGQVHWLRGAYGQALSFHRQALAIRRAIGDSRSIALSLANIGRVHHETGSFKAAARQFSEALSLRREIDDRAGVIQSLCDIGRVESSAGNFEKGMVMFMDAKTIALAIGDRLALTDVLAGLGECQASLGQYSDAIESLLEGKSVAHMLGNRPGASDCYRRLAEIYLAGGDCDQALDSAERALALGEEIGARLQIGRAHRVMAESVFAKGRTDEESLRADEHFRKAVEILAGRKSELELARTYRAYAVLREHLGKLEEAEKLRRRSDEIFERLHGSNHIVSTEEPPNSRLGTVSD